MTMMALLSCGLFVVTFAVTFRLLIRCTKRPDVVLERLTVVPKLEPNRKNAASLWRAALTWLGGLHGGQNKERLRKDFIRGGIRSPRAGTVFQGMKTLGALLGAVVVGGVMVAQKAEGSRVLMAAIAGIGGGYLLPDKILQFRIRTRKTRIRKALPNALDLLTICVEAGLGLDQAVVQVSRELANTYPDISDELAMISLEMRAGKRRSDCLRDFGERTGIAEVKKLAAVLIQADRFGTSIAQSLRVHSEHLRIQTRQAAEEKAAKLGVKLVFPIFFFILPSLFVITVGPVVVRIFQDLLPMLNSL